MRLVLAFLLFLIVRPAFAGEMLVLSDIHFNPLADKTLVDRLAAAPAEQWATLLDTGTQRMSTYGSDTNWALLRASLAAMKVQPKPDLVLIPGDFVVHRFRALFEAEAGDHSAAALRRFTAETIRFVGLQLKAAFPATPILTVLGNNDSTCGDYEERPGGQFLADTAGLAAELAGPTAGDEFLASWRALGNYVLPNPAAPNHMIVALNTNFFSPHYKNNCGGAGDVNPAEATLAWLERTLATTEAQHRTIWLAYHVPPGADAFATARHDICTAPPVPMFVEPYAARFHALMLRYHATVAASFAGHTHMDGFRLLSEGGQPFGFVMMNPALSPIFGQNPAFRRVTVNGDATITDQTVSYLANLPDAVGGAVPQWQQEADFATAWHLKRFDLANLEQLYRRLGHSAADRSRYFDQYAVQGPARNDIATANAAVYRCTAGGDLLAEVAHCICAGGN